MVGVAEASTRGVLAVDAMVLCGVAVYAASRREEPGAVSFGAAVLSLAVAAGVVAIVGRIGGTRSPSWAAVAALLIVFVTCWLLFVTAYTGEWSGQSFGPMQLLAVLLAAGVLTVGYISLSGESMPQLLTARGPVYAVVVTVPVIVVSALFLSGIFTLVRAGIRYASADVRRTGTLAVGAFAGGFLPLLSVGVVTPSGVDVAPGFAGTSLLAAGSFGIAVVRYDLFDSVPVTEAIGRQRLVTEIDDLVLVVDRDGAVVDLNDAARRALEVSMGAAVGEPLAELLDVDAPVMGVETVEIAAEDGRHVYEASVSELCDDAERVVGHGLVLRDVTDRRTRRQRLEVLNRVLRHNLRNDMTTVMGYADLIAEDRGEPADLVERIHETADTLTDLGDKAREIEKIMAASDVEDVATDAGRVLQYVVAEAETKYPEADVAVDLERSPTVAAADQVLWPVVWNLVENACEHGDDAPTIRIAAETDGDRVAIDVVDDGPGIPENERRAITAGEEHPLSHGSGLGLWAVKWGANRVGGDVEIADVEPRGTRVTVRLPKAEPGARPTVPDR